MKKKLFQRVDFQVATLVVTIVAISTLITFYLVYSMSYTEMIGVLEKNSISIATYIDEKINSDIFTEIKVKEDMNSELYDEAYSLFNDVRSITGTKYLYTATKNANGDLIYHIDGLPTDDPDFRNVGDMIEAEFQEPLLRALENEIIIPDNILHTEWGDVYVAYYPLHGENNEVIAALGIEFLADNQADAYERIRIFLIGIITLICLASGIFAHFLFKRISNPHFKDIYNTDSLTKLKNRNAFDTDTNNSIQKHNLDGAILVLSDLNGLKQVNDKNGHKLGDFYIDACAKALLVDGIGDHVVYRIGGDEFATIISATKGDEDLHLKVDTYMNKVKSKLKDLCKDVVLNASVSMGYAICRGSGIDAWELAQREADAAMYKDKRAYYEKNKDLDGRK